MQRTIDDTMHETPPTCGKQGWRQYALLLATLSSLLGCSTVVGQVGATVAVGAVYLSKERATIRVTEEITDIMGCTFIKQVQAKTYWGGVFLQNKALEKTISDLTHDSVMVGANVLLVRTKSKGFFGSEAVGDAYWCPLAASTPPAGENRSR